MKTKALRRPSTRASVGLCFYCLRHLTALVRTLDHVVPRVELGRNSYPNLVSCCLECNSKKGHSPAADFLRWLYRKRPQAPLDRRGLRQAPASSRHHRQSAPPQRPPATSSRRPVADYTVLP